MGMAPGREYYTLETVAHRDGYEKEDVDRRTMREDRYWREEVGSPEVLEPRWEGWSGDDVWRRWKGGLMVSEFVILGNRRRVGRSAGNAKLIYL